MLPRRNSPSSSVIDLRWQLKWKEKPAHTQNILHLRFSVLPQVFTAPLEYLYISDQQAPHSSHDSRIKTDLTTTFSVTVPISMLETLASINVKHPSS